MIYIDEIEKEKQDTNNEIEEGEEIEQQIEDMEDIEEQHQYAITIELGDVIELNAPTNPDLHESTLYVTYIDELKLIATNIASFEKIQLNINNERFTDESIRQIAILSRSEVSGYARQNGLVLAVWVDIQFGGEIPVIITGEITNLEEDQIEITTFPDLDAIYIDFEYKGLPEHIPIREIVIRPKPTALSKTNLLKLREGKEDGEVIDLDELLKKSEESEESEEKDDKIKLPENGEPEDNIYYALQNLCRKSTIVFGKYLDTVSQVVEVREDQKRYHIDIQLNSLMDEYLSTVPNYQRTKKFMDGIHILIERFRELRLMFSNFDENADIKSLKIKGPSYKPIIEHIYDLDMRIKWLVPVVSLIKKIYSIGSNTKNNIQIGDAVEYNMTILQEEENTKNQTFYKNHNKIDEVKYANMYKQINDYQTPFQSPYNNKATLSDKEVKANLEAIIDNLGDFFSTTIKEEAKKHVIARQKYVIQTYNLGLSQVKPHMEKGVNIYMTEQMTPSDRIHIKSFIMMPLPVINYSRVDLPSTNIMDKVNLSHKQFLLFRILKKNHRILPYIVDDLTKELNYEDRSGFLSNIKEFILSDEVGIGDKQRYNKFLDVIIPKTNVIIQIMKKHMKNKLSFQSITKYLEPFGISHNDITYSKHFTNKSDVKSSFNEIKDHIDSQLNEIRKTYKYKSILFEKILQQNKNSINILPIIKILFEKKENLDLLLESYKLPDRDSISKLMTSPEVLAHIMRIDNGTLYSLMLSSLMSTLYSPNNLNLYGKNGDIKEDMANIEKIKPRDCSRKILAKKYKSIENLQKDNGHIDVYYDKDYDDTPYDIINKYKEDKKKILPENFPEFLTENLIQKHDCPINIAPELATTLIAGKRGIKEGEYAILELRPHLPKDVDESSLDAKTKEQISVESEARVKYQYYRRIKDHWVQDRDIDENAFLDNNTLFCNIQSDCMKVELGCISSESAIDRIKRIASNQAKKEFENRIEVGVKEIEENILSDIKTHLHRIVKLNVLDIIQKEKTNYLANSIGTQADKSDIIQSPYSKLRDLILGQADFAKKQRDIVMFTELFARDAMVDELGDKLSWKYCKITNIPLMPTFLYDLAKEFISGGDYSRLLDEISANIGTLSDDGDSIVDKETGYIIRKIDFSTEEGFTEGGFRITTHSVMEKDLGTVILQNLKKERVFENESSEVIYKIFSFISSNIGLTTESIYDFVQLIASELIQKTVMSEDSYKKRVEKLEKEKNIKSAPYIKYKNKTIILIVTSVIFVAIQTTIPTFFTKKTYPGCVRSFDGYPLTGIENTSGIRYLACILEKSRSSIEPWDSIKTVKTNDFVEQLKNTIEKLVINHAKVEEAYLLKRQYLEQNPQIDIIEEHAVEKWQNFLPPLINVQVNIKSIGEDFRADLLEDIRKGHIGQNAKELVLKSKAIQFTAAIIESIQSIVHKRELFLKTSSNQPFLQNSCCNEKEKSIIPILYFADEDEKIKMYIKSVVKCGELTYMIKWLSKASFFFHNLNTRPIKPIIQTGITDENLYETIIHYLGLDRGLSIPSEFHSIMQEIPDGFNSQWSIVDKIEFLKRHGKRLDENQFREVMRIVEKRNMVEVYRKKSDHSPVNALRDILATYEKMNIQNPILDKGLCKNMDNILEKYQPKTMHPIDEEKNKEIHSLKQYLLDANLRMHKDIMDFFDQYGNLNTKTFNGINSFFKSITEFNIEEDITKSNKYLDMGLFQIAKFMKNSIYDIIRVLPNMILNDINPGQIPSYWGLSDYDYFELQNFIDSYIKPLNDFKSDIVIHDLIKGIQLNMTDLFTFIQHIPIYNPILHEKVVYYSLFDKQSIYLLLSYALYSVLYEYITMANNDKYLKRDKAQSKEERRGKIKENKDPSHIKTDFINLDEVYEEGYEELDEVQIEEGNQIELKQRVAKVLLGYLSIIEQNKTYANYSYEIIDRKIRKSREQEKKMITDRFKKITVDERKVENMMKTYKIGKWNVGQQKGLVVYDKETSDRERQERDEREEKEIDFYLIHQEIGQEEGEEEEGDEDENQFQKDYDEQTNIKNMHKDYNDGILYDEDAEEDFVDDD